jgi:CRP-like cAMP-binding protein
MIPSVRASVPPEQAQATSAAAESNLLLMALPWADAALLTPYLSEARFEPGAVIQEAGQRLRQVFFVRRGLVGLLCPAPDGPATEIVGIGPEGAVGLAERGLAAAHSRAVAHTPVQAARVSLERLSEAVARSATLRRVIEGHAAFMFAQAQQIAACSASHSIPERVCRWLLQARERTGADVLPFTQEFLAGLLQVQRTTITAVARRLQSHGVIKVWRGRIEILNVAVLEDKACTCHNTLLRLKDDHARLLKAPLLRSAPAGRWSGAAADARRTP